MYALFYVIFNTKYIYMAGQVVVDLGLVDINFCHSTTCPILLGHLEVWQNRLWRWAR